MIIQDLRNIYRWPFKKQLGIYLLVFIIVFYFLHRLFLSTITSELEANKKKESELKSQIKSLIIKEQLIKAEVAQSHHLQSLLLQWKDELTTRKNLPELINAILKIGANNNIYFAAFNPDTEIPSNAYIKVPINVVIVGNYHQIGNFISQVANLPTIVSIGNFTLSTEHKIDVLGKQLFDQAIAHNLLTADFNFEIYFLSEKK
jgi:type IV pilus assembly protein PilO